MVKMATIAIISDLEPCMALVNIELCRPLRGRSAGIVIVDPRGIQDVNVCLKTATMTLSLGRRLNALA